MAKNDKPRVNPILRAVLVVAAALLGCYAGWYYEQPEHPLLGLFFGAIFGGYAASWVIDMATD